MKTGRWLRQAALCAVAATLAACAGTGASGKQELITASDYTAAQKRASIRIQLAVGYYERGQLEVALDEVKQALVADPQYADAYGVRAVIYMAMGQFELAEDNFKHALKLAPNNPELSNNYGSFLCQHERAAQAMPYFEAALKNPTYQSPVSALTNAGTCSLKMHDNAAAERYLLEALRLAPDLAMTNVHLARVYFERRDYPRAGFFVNRLRAATKLDTLSADALWLAARVERKLGDKEAETSMVAELRRHHPGSSEFAAFQRGAFDE